MFSGFIMPNQDGFVLNGFTFKYEGIVGDGAQLADRSMSSSGVLIHSKSGEYEPGKTTRRIDIRQVGDSSITTLNTGLSSLLGNGYHNTTYPILSISEDGSRIASAGRSHFSSTWSLTVFADTSVGSDWSSWSRDTAFPYPLADPVGLKDLKINHDGTELAYYHNDGDTSFPSETDKVIVYDRSSTTWSVKAKTAHTSARSYNRLFTSNDLSRYIFNEEIYRYDSGSTYTLEHTLPSSFFTSEPKVYMNDTNDKIFIGNSSNELTIFSRTGTTWDSGVTIDVPVGDTVPNSKFYYVSPDGTKLVTRSTGSLYANVTYNVYTIDVVAEQLVHQQTTTAFVNGDGYHDEVFFFNTSYIMVSASEDISSSEPNYEVYQHDSELRRM